MCRWYVPRRDDVGSKVQVLRRARVCRSWLAMFGLSVLAREKDHIVREIELDFGDGINAPNGINVHLLGASERRLKSIPVPHVLINTSPPVDSPTRVAWEAPFSGIEKQ